MVKSSYFGKLTAKCECNTLFTFSLRPKLRLLHFDSISTKPGNLKQRLIPSPMQSGIMVCLLIIDFHYFLFVIQGQPQMWRRMCLKEDVHLHSNECSCLKSIKCCLHSGHTNWLKIHSSVYFDMWAERCLLNECFGLCLD